MTNALTGDEIFKKRKKMITKKVEKRKISKKKEKKKKKICTCSKLNTINTIPYHAFNYFQSLPFMMLIAPAFMSTFMSNPTLSCPVLT